MSHYSLGLDKVRVLLLVRSATQLIRLSHTLLYYRTSFVILIYFFYLYYLY